MRCNGIWQVPEGGEMHTDRLLVAKTDGGHIEDSGLESKIILKLVT
jgi:hypothetical protein